MYYCGSMVLYQFISPLFGNRSGIETRLQNAVFHLLRNRHKIERFYKLNCTYFINKSQFFLPGGNLIHIFEQVSQQPISTASMTKPRTWKPNAGTRRIGRRGRWMLRLERRSHGGLGKRSRLPTSSNCRSGGVVWGFRLNKTQSRLI